MKLVRKLGINKGSFSAILFILSIPFLSCSDGISEMREHLLHGKKFKVTLKQPDSEAGSIEATPSIPADGMVPAGRLITFIAKPNSNFAVMTWKGATVDGDDRNKATLEVREDIEISAVIEKVKILFFKQGSNNRNQIYAMDLDGKNEKQLTSFTDNSSSHPSWSPDANTFVFQRDNKIYRMNHDGTGLKYITEGIYPTYSPDGKKLAYLSSNEKTLYTANSDDGSNKEEIKTLTENNYKIQYTSWSPNGKKILFVKYKFNKSDYSIQILDLKDKSSSKLDITGLGDPQSATWHLSVNKILYYSKLGTGTFLQTINADGSNNEVLIKGNSGGSAEFKFLRAGSYSPDGEKIVFSAVPNGETISQIFIADAHGNNVEQITHSSKNCFEPCWWGKPR